MCLSKLYTVIRKRFDFLQDPTKPRTATNKVHIPITTDAAARPTSIS